MIKATTPIFYYALPFEYSTLSYFEIYFSQGGKLVVTKKPEDCTVKNNVIFTQLTQEETLLFEDDSVVELQFRAKSQGENVIATMPYKVVASPIASEEIFDVSESAEGAGLQIPADFFETISGKTATFGEFFVVNGNAQFVQVQSDWEQMDETAPDFVKNRTHYDVFEKSEEFSLGEGSDWEVFSHSMGVGGTYRIDVSTSNGHKDSFVYHCEPNENPEDISSGFGFSTTDPTDGSVITLHDGGSSNDITVNRTSANSTVTIEIFSYVGKQLDTRYIPVDNDTIVPIGGRFVVNPHFLDHFATRTELMEASVKIEKHDERITNIERHISDDYFVTDDSVAYDKAVAENVCPYAQIDRIGGMTHRKGDTLVSAKATDVYSYNESGTQEDLFVVPYGLQVGDGVVALNSSNKMSAVYGDYIEFDGEYARSYKACETIKFTGSEQWIGGATDGNANNYFYCELTKDTSKYQARAVACDKYDHAYISSSVTNIGIDAFSSSAFGAFVVVVRPPNVEQYTGAEFTQYMRENPITIVLAKKTATLVATEKAENIIKVSPNGILRFENTEKQAVPSSITYLVKEGSV